MSSVFSILACGAVALAIVSGDERAYLLSIWLLLYAVLIAVWDMHRDNKGAK